VREQSVYELVKLYQQGRGADDVAGPALQSRGESARAELIKMLDDPSTLDEDAGTIIEILHVYFPAQESYEAMDRYANKIRDPKDRAKVQEIIRLMQANDPRKQ
jgi:hypothetical protein